MILKQLGPYGIVAGLCVAAHLVIMIGGDLLGAHFVLSTTVSFVTCVLIGYSLHSRFTFIREMSFAGLLRYALAMAFNFPLSIIAVWFFYELLGQPMIIAAPASTLVMTLYNFITSRWAITSGNPERHSERALDDQS